jgi:dolichol-phosphate mannosyltransferase
MPEYNRFFPMMVNWVGFSKTTIEIEHGQRGDGTSGYNLHALLTLALNTTLSYSDKPLRYVVKAGLIISLFTFLYALLVLFRYFRGEIIVLGYTSLVISIWFLGGILLFTVGMVGLYVGKIFEEVKGRPTFIIEKKLN